MIIQCALSSFLAALGLAEELYVRPDVLAAGQEDAVLFRDEDGEGLVAGPALRTLQLRVHHRPPLRDSQVGNARRIRSGKRIHLPVGRQAQSRPVPRCQTATADLCYGLMMIPLVTRYLFGPPHLNTN